MNERVWAGAYGGADVVVAEGDPSRGTARGDSAGCETPAMLAEAPDGAATNEEALDEALRQGFGEIIGRDVRLPGGRAERLALYQDAKDPAGTLLWAILVRKLAEPTDVMEALWAAHVAARQLWGLARTGCWPQDGEGEKGAVGAALWRWLGPQADGLARRVRPALVCEWADLAVRRACDAAECDLFIWQGWEHEGLGSLQCQEPLREVGTEPPGDWADEAIDAFVASAEKMTGEQTRLGCGEDAERG